MQIYTKPKVLARVYQLLKEIGLEGLLGGDAVRVDLNKVLDALLIQGRLNEFFQIITQTEVDFTEMELADLVEVAKGFFDCINGPFRRLGLGLSPVGTPAATAQ